MRKTKHILTGEMQTALSLLLLFALCIISFIYPSYAQQNVTQKATGNQNTNINAPGGKVYVNYSGISEARINKILEQQGRNQKIVNYLLKTIEKNNVAIADRDAKIEELSKKYTELKVSLSQRPANDILAAKARKRLEEGDQEGAEKLLRQSLENNLQNSKQKMTAAAADAYELGALKELRLDYQGAKIFYEQATRLAPSNRDYLYQMGVLCEDLGEPKNAIKYFSMALDIDLEIHGGKHPNVGRDYYNLGWAWQDMQLSEPKKALDYFLKALDIDLNTFGEKHTSVAKDYNALGTVYCDLGEHKKGIEYLSKALEIDLILANGVADKNVSGDYLNLGKAWWMSGDSKKASEHFSISHNINLMIYGTIHPRTAMDYIGLGVASSESGESKKAIEYYSKALEIDLKVFDQRHPVIGVIYVDLGHEWTHLRETNKAIDCYSNALDIFITKYGEEHRMIPIIKSYIDAAKKVEQSKRPANSIKDR